MNGGIRLAVRNFKFDSIKIRKYIICVERSTSYYIDTVLFYRKENNTINYTEETRSVIHEKYAVYRIIRVLENVFTRRTSYSFILHNQFNKNGLTLYFGYANAMYVHRHHIIMYVINNRETSVFYFCRLSRYFIG